MLVSSFIARGTSFEFRAGGILTSELSLSLPAKSSELSLDSVCTLRAMQIATCDLCQLVLLYNMYLVINLIVVMVDWVLVL